MTRPSHNHELKPCPKCHKMMSLLSNRIPPLQPRVLLPLAWICTQCEVEFEVEQDPKDAFIIDLWKEKEAAVAVLHEIASASITTLDGGTIIPVGKTLKERLTKAIDPKKMSECTLCGDDKGFWCDRQGRYWCVTCIEIALVQAGINDDNEDDDM